MVDIGMEVSGYRPPLHNERDLRQKDEVDRLLEDPRYAKVGQTMERLSRFFAEEDWNFTKLMRMQNELVKDLVKMPDWRDEDIKALAKIKAKYMDNNQDFLKGFDKKENPERDTKKAAPNKRITPDNWWAGFVGEAAFMKCWSKKAGLYIADTGEASRHTSHDKEMDEKGIDFVTYIDYADNFESDKKYKVFINLKTRSDMDVGGVEVVELRDKVAPEQITTYFNVKRSPEDLLNLAASETEDDVTPCVLFVLMGRGRNDWKGMMEMAMDPEFALDIATKIDDALRMKSDDDYSESGYRNGYEEDWRDQFDVRPNNPTDKTANYQKYVKMAGDKLKEDEKAEAEEMELEKQREEARIRMTYGRKGARAGNGI